MTEEELYAGAGEVARKCLDDILESEYGFVQDDEETYTSEYLLTYPCKTFAEGLMDTLLQHGFSGQAVDAKEKIAYIRECCKQRGVTLNPEVIKSWFCRTRPNSGERSRDSLFRLCFALGLNDRETASFFSEGVLFLSLQFPQCKRNSDLVLSAKWTGISGNAVSGRAGGTADKWGKYDRGRAVL